MAPRGGSGGGTAAPADNAQALRKQRAAVVAIAADNAKLKEELMLENKFRCALRVLGCAAHLSFRAYSPGWLSGSRRVWG